MNSMQYKGYSARIEFSAEDGCLVGHVLGIRNIISFHADSVDAIETEFHGMIDFYLDCCRKNGEKPEKPYSGDLMLRLTPERHRKIAYAAEFAGKSINEVIATAIDTVYSHDDEDTGAVMTKRRRRVKAKA